MLDLESLERQMDEALEKETSVSISSWLHKRRVKDIFNLTSEDLKEEGFPLTLVVGKEPVTLYSKKDFKALESLLKAIKVEIPEHMVPPSCKGD